MKTTAKAGACLICNRDANSKPRYRQPAHLEAARTATGKGSRALEDWYCFHARTIPEPRAFWDVYGICPEDRGYVIPILRRICLDCFDLAWQAARRPGYTYDTINEKVSELCARALRGGKHAPSFEIAPLSLERASAIAEWDQEAQRRELDAIAEKIEKAGNWFVWRYHLDKHNNRNLSMSVEPPAIMYKYRAAYRHARKLAGIRGQVCRMAEWPHLEYYDRKRRDRSLEAAQVFRREAEIVGRVRKEVEVQLQSLAETGRIHVPFYSWHRGYQWEGNLAGQMLFEDDRKGEAIAFRTHDGVQVAMLNPNVVPLTVRLTYFKAHRADALEFQQRRCTAA